MSKDVSMVTIPSLLYEALCNVDAMVRVAMTIPDSGEMLVAAMHAIDTVRAEYGIETDNSPKGMSKLLSDLLNRVENPHTKNS